MKSTSSTILHAYCVTPIPILLYYAEYMWVSMPLTKEVLLSVHYSNAIFLAIIPGGPKVLLSVHYSYAIFLAIIPRAPKVLVIIDC